MMSDSERAGSGELLAIPRLAERVGVTPRVLRYWEEQGLISPTREHGKLRYSPRDVAIAALIRKLLDAGAGVEGVRMLKRLAERDIRRSSTAGDETALIEAALQILYQHKAFREETGMDEEHYPEGKPPPPPPRGGPARGPGPPAGLGTKREMAGTSRPKTARPSPALRAVRPGVSQRGSHPPRRLAPSRPGARHPRRASHRRRPRAVPCPDPRTRLLPDHVMDGSGQGLRVYMGHAALPGPIAVTGGLDGFRRSRTLLRRVRGGHPPFHPHAEPGCPVIT